MTVCFSYYFIRKRKKAQARHYKLCSPTQIKIKKETVNTTRSNFLCDLPFRQNEPLILVDD
jgi:hypothetical protein